MLTIHSPLKRLESFGRKHTTKWESQTGLIFFSYYHDNIVFQDSIQRIEGKDKFLEMCNRLTKRCRSLKMDIYSITKTDNIVMMDWKMTMSFRKFPDKPIYGATKLTFNSEGFIIEQGDYYDLWGDIYDGIPFVRAVYRGFMRKFFG